MHASFCVEAKLRAFLRTEAPQASSGFFGLLRAWIASGAVWCPPQARHGLSITHLSAGCQGFEALSKASAAADRRAKTVWKMFAQMDTRTAPPMMHTVQQALARGTGVRLQKLGTGHRSASRPAGTGRHRALR